MKTLNREYLSFELDDWTLKDTLQLDFDPYEDGPVDYVNLSKKYKHSIQYKVDESTVKKIEELNEAFCVWVVNIRELRKVINEEESVPHFEFRYENIDGTTIESKIALRDFMKKYIYEGDLLEELKEESGSYAEDELPDWVFTP